MRKPSFYDEDEIARLLSGISPPPAIPAMAPVIEPPKPADDDILQSLLKPAEPSLGDKFRTFGLGAGDAISHAYGGNTRFLPQDIEAEKEKRSSALNNYLMKRKMDQEGVTEGREAERYQREKSGAETKRKMDESLDDIASPQSRTLQSMATRLDSSNDYSSLSARQLTGIIDDLRAGKKDAAEAELGRLRLEAIKEENAGKREDRQRDIGQKNKVESDKKTEIFKTIEDRRQNINSAIDTLDKMIDEKGTYEVFGSHNADLNRLVDGIATDMAKLQDPNSVARPGEVELVKRTLVQAGMTGRNATARNVLKNFKAEVDRRANSAYKVRGFEVPGAVASTNAEGETPEEEYARRKKARAGVKFTPDVPEPEQRGVD